MKRLAAKGIVKGKKRPAPITFDYEEDLKKKGILCDNSPRKLIETLICSHYISLRADKEHRDQVFGEDSQLEFVEMDGECIRYIDRISKNRTFELKHSTMDLKTTLIYPQHN